MKLESIFTKTASFSGVYVFFISNRLQVIYFLIIMPSQIKYPYMIFGILLMGLLSQLNLIILAKGLGSDTAAKGLKGFTECFGRPIVRIGALAGVFFIMIKLIVTVLGFVEIIHQFIFPTMSEIWIILLVFLTGCYLASKGIENTIRFSSIVFFSTIWFFLLFTPFFFPPLASINGLFPFIPTESFSKVSEKLMFVWSSLSGPEYLIFLAPWLGKTKKALKPLSYANALSIFEYLLLFIHSLLFFGPDYLKHLKFPMMNMIEFLESPLFERIDVLLISVHTFIFVFASAFFFWCLYGAFRIVLGRQRKKSTRFGFLTCAVTMATVLIVVNLWFWPSELKQNHWLNTELWAGAVSYLLLPAGFLIFNDFRKKGSVHQ